MVKRSANGSDLPRLLSVQGHLLGANITTMPSTFRQTLTISAPTGQVLVGTGFLALDLLFRNTASVPAKRYAGGSFGNVMAILAYLGWKSYPVARLGVDRYSSAILKDLEGFSVKTKFVHRMPTGATPIIVVRIIQKDGGGFESRFEWKDPRSGNRLPSYRPLPKGLAEEISKRLPAARIFYFDRAEPASLLLAKAMRERGALVFFEPSSCKDHDMFAACMAVSDIVKYSAQRIANPPEIENSDSPRLEIQTLADQGLRYRIRTVENHLGAWKQLTPFTVDSFKDSTGCGDWCSAGILHKIGLNGRQGFLAADELEIIQSLNFGQALGAINGQYEGARGPMYKLKKHALMKSAQQLLSAA